MKISYLMMSVYFLLIGWAIKYQSDRVIKTIEVFHEHPKAGKTYYEYNIINGDTIPTDTIYYDY